MDARAVGDKNLFAVLTRSSNPSWRASRSPTGSYESIRQGIRRNKQLPGGLDRSHLIAGPLGQMCCTIQMRRLLR
jgi:hypothetical protein